MSRMDYEVRNDMTGQAKSGLRVSKVKIRKHLPGTARVNLLEFLQSRVECKFSKFELFLKNGEIE